MSFIKKIPVFIFGFIFTVIIIAALLIFSGIISIPQLHAKYTLRENAEDYVNKTYGNHYYISQSRIDGERYNLFQDYVYGVEYTFSDKNKNEKDFTIYVGNDNGSAKTITDQRYHSYNESVFKKCFYDYIKNQLAQYNIPKKALELDVSIYDPDYAMYTDHALTYDNYDNIISDNAMTQKLEISVNVTISDKSQNNNDYSDTVKNLYAYLNKAEYRKFEFYFTDIKHESLNVNIYSGITVNGQPDKNYVPQNEIYLDPYYTDSYKINYINLSSSN